MSGTIPDVVLIGLHTEGVKLSARQKAPFSPSGSVIGLSEMSMRKVGMRDTNRATTWD